MTVPPSYLSFYPLGTPRVADIIDKLQKGTRLTKGEEFELKEAIKQQNRLDFDLRELLMYGLIFKLMKTPKGLEVLKVLGKEFIKGMFDTLHALGQASASNKVSSWANPFLVSMVLDRFGFLRGEHLGTFHLGLDVIAGAGVVEGFVDTIQGFFPFTAPEQSEYPTNIVFSARQTSEGLETTYEAKGLTLEQLEQLRQMVTKK